MSRGIRSPQELAAMSTAEVQALIFAPGFSTRTAVTEISDRGVGLDVVRANVEHLKGSIQLEFTPGRGCLFRIMLNSSLATTDALIVQVSEHPCGLCGSDATGISPGNLCLCERSGSGVTNVRLPNPAIPKGVRICGYPNK